MVVEPASIISACADGRRAAEAICHRLGVDFTPPPSRPPVLTDDDVAAIQKVRARRFPRIEPPMLPVHRRGGFTLIESTYTDEDARLEALRCVQCTTICDKCVEVCPNRANYAFVLTPVHWTLPVIQVADGRPSAVGTEEFRVAQWRQILHVDDFCNECDNCQTFCVHRGRPYADKPRLFLDPALFAREAGNAFRIEGPTIRRREGGVEWRLTVDEGGFFYDDAVVTVQLTRDWQLRRMAVTAPYEGPRSLRPAAEMAVLHEGITRALPFLLVD
jgi:putative selenate reductase